MGYVKGRVCPRCKNLTRLEFAGWSYGGSERNGKLKRHAMWKCPKCNYVKFM